MHTPGPWHWTTHPDGTMITNDSGASIALWPSQGGTVEQCANGRLMAAAPDLLAALRSLMALDVKGHALADRLHFSDAGRALLNQCRAAINRATTED